MSPHVRTGVLLVVLPLLLAACGGAIAPPAPTFELLPTPTAPSGGPGIGDEELVMVKSPTCGCCGGHEAYLRAGGMTVSVEETDDVAAVKDRLAIPAEMRSCHTSLVAGYFVEGHVPLAAIERLLRERPDIDGIALPGMPPGSPGMGGVQEGPFTVFAVDEGRVVGVFGDF